MNKLINCVTVVSGSFMLPLPLVQSPREDLGREAQSPRPLAPGRHPEDSKSPVKRLLGKLKEKFEKRPSQVKVYVDNDYSLPRVFIADRVFLAEEVMHDLDSIARDDRTILYLMTQDNAMAQTIGDIMIQL